MIIAIIIAGFVGWVAGLLMTRRIHSNTILFQSMYIAELKDQINIYQQREYERIAHETHQLALH